MRKILFLILIFMLIRKNLGGSNNSTIDVANFINPLDSMAVAGLMNYTHVSAKDDSPEPSDVCQCDKKTGKISYDGGTSVTDCPCALGGGNCGCPHCSKSSTVAQDALDVNYDNYYVVKVTASWCGPCAVWGRNEKPKFEAAGIEVVEIDYDRNPSAAKAMGATALPSFYICTKADRKSGGFHLFHKVGRNYEHVGPDFTVSKFKDMVSSIDEVLHPSKDEGIWYDRQQSSVTKLNSKDFASKSEYESHLKSDNHSKLNRIPFNKFSAYELKAMHDDDHAGKLGKIYGI